MTDRTEDSLKPEPASADQSRYLIHSRLEIAAILKTLSRSGRMVTAYFGADDDFILTSILAVNADQNTAFIDCDANAASSRRALQAKNITFVAVHDRIKIQFSAASLSQTRLDGRDVFSMPIPATLLRLQRREYFRITTPLTRPLVCIIDEQASPEREQTEMVIVDISCGGVAVIDPAEPAEIEVGARLRGCRIPLPEIGQVAVDIVVKSASEVTLKNGKTQRHAGCEFLNMKERDRGLIQRYISRLERERTHRGGAR
ncbi:MAG: flagellar brake protein [Burkholderiales bacterium]|nr:flagellar brake protein [Burkholderiales bacterium]